MRIVPQDGCSWLDNFTCLYRAVLVVVAWPSYAHLIWKEVYNLILLSKILDLEADDLSLHISSDTDLKTTKTDEDDLSLVF